MSTAATAEVRGRFDALQFRALAELLLKQSFRPGVDPSTGVRGHPLRQVVFSMALLGAVFCANVRRCPEAGAFVVLLFATTAALTAFAVNPETQDVMMRRMELLHSKPIGTRTMSTARTALVAVMAAAITAPFALFPLAVAWRWYRLPPLAVMAAAPAVFLAGFTACVLWLALGGVSMRWLTPERLRTVGQSLFMAVGLLLTAFALDWLPAARATELLRPLPSTWFAALALPVSGTTEPAQKAGALALLALAGTLVWNGGLDVQRAERLQSAWRGKGGRPRLAPTAALLERLAARPAAARVLPPPEAAVASAVLTLTGRDEVSRLKTRLPRLMALAAFAAALFGLQPLLVVNLLAYLGFSGVVEGTEMASQTSAPGAGWIFRGAPLTSAHLVRGLRLAVAARFLFVPAALLFVLLLRIHRASLAAALALDYVLAAAVLLALGLVVHPVLPLAAGHRAMSPLWALVAGFAATVVGGIAYAAVALLDGAAPAAALAVALAAAPLLGALAWALRVAAAARLDSLEHA